MKKPTLRFKAFDSEWDNVPFDKGMSFLSNNTLSRADLNNVAGDVLNVHYGDVLIKFGEVLDLTKEELPFINAEFDFSKLSSSMLTDGDIVIADTAEDETAGKCTEIRNVENNKVLAGLHTMPCRPNAKYASGYLGYYMNSPAYHNQLLKYMQGTKVVSISKSALGNTVLAYPSDKTEQKAIGSFFTELDSLIEGKRVKLDKLKKLKLAYLGKMFPKKGSRVPEVRFKGFTGGWKEVEFGSILEECLDRSVQENEDTLLSSSIEGMFLNSELFGHQRGASNKGYRKLQRNMLVLSAQNLHLGNANVNLRFEHGLVSPAYKIYFIKGCSPLFLSAWIKKEETKHFFLMATTEGASGCRKNVEWNYLYKQQLFIPVCDEEQTQVGAFFQNLDNLINLQQQELDKLANIKSACLSKMFA